MGAARGSLAGPEEMGVSRLTDHVSRGGAMRQFMVAFKTQIKVYKSWREHDAIVYDSDCRKLLIDHERASRLDTSVIEGPEFGGVSRPELINHFNQWAGDICAQDEVNEDEYDKVFTKNLKMDSCPEPGDMYEQRIGQPQYLSLPRYRFFVQVDEDCVESVLSATANREGIALSDFNGWINIVNAQWSSTAPVLDNLKFRPLACDPDIVFDNGCWFRATPSYLYPYLCAALCLPLMTEEYLRPPRVVTHVKGGFSPEHGQNVQDIKDDVQVMLHTRDRLDGIWCYDDDNPEPMSADEDDEADGKDFYVSERMPTSISEAELAAKRAQEDEEYRAWVTGIQLNIDDNSDFATNWTKPYAHS